MGTGARLITVKRSTIFIGIGEDLHVYQSADEIPSELRKQLMASTKGMNSATILIADRGGRAEIRKVLNGQPSPLRSRLRPEHLRKTLAITKAPPVPGWKLEIAKEAAAAAPGWRDWTWRHWAELFLPGAIGISLWLLFTLK